MFLSEVKITDYSSQKSSSKLSKIFLVQTFGLSLRGVENAIVTTVSTFSPSLNTLHKVLLTLVASGDSLLHF